MRLRLAGGGWQAEILPGLGGAIGSLAFNGRDVLRPTPVGATDVLATACFPLVPYANRIAHGRFQFGGKSIGLPVLPAFAPHAIHGVGWQRAWRVTRRSEDAVSLSLEAGGEDAWPWRFEATQQICVGQAGLEVALSVINRDEHPMPAGLGLHPYFPIDVGSRLKFAATGVWLSDETLIPVRQVSPGEVQDFARARVLPSAKGIDHCYTGWDGLAELTGPDIAVTIRADTGHLHVFAPPEGGYCCVEPVTQRPDALHPLPRESVSAPILPGECSCINLCVSAFLLQAIEI